MKITSYLLCCLFTVGCAFHNIGAMVKELKKTIQRTADRFEGIKKEILESKDTRFNGVKKGMQELPDTRDVLTNPEKYTQQAKKSFWGAKESNSKIPIRENRGLSKSAPIKPKRVKESMISSKHLLGIGFGGTVLVGICYLLFFRKNTPNHNN